MHAKLVGAQPISSASSAAVRYVLMTSPYQEIKMTEPSDLVLSPEEIYAITHYKLPKKQLAALQEMGIQATLRRIDNTVCVLRAHVTNPSAQAKPAGPGPVRKSVREREGGPQLKSSRGLEKQRRDFLKSCEGMKLRVKPS
jgi:hypothetical protein